MTSPDITIQRAEKNLENLATLASLRIKVFREWPYFYDGDLAYEENYLRKFLGSEDAVLILATAEDASVGMATASPMSSQASEITIPISQAGFDLSRCFYFGESVLLPQYRGMGIGHRFFDERELAAKALGASSAVFCAVIREDGDPRRPDNVHELSAFWRRRGYEPLKGLHCSIKWKEVGQAGERPHLMQFWSKNLG